MHVYASAEKKKREFQSRKMMLCVKYINPTVMPCDTRSLYVLFLIHACFTLMTSDAMSRRRALAYCHKLCSPQAVRWLLLLEKLILIKRKKGKRWRQRWRRRQPRRRMETTVTNKTLQSYSWIFCILINIFVALFNIYYVLRQLDLTYKYSVLALISASVAIVDVVVVIVFFASFSFQLHHRFISFHFFFHSYVVLTNIIVVVICLSAVFFFFRSSS